MQIQQPKPVQTFSRLIGGGATGDPALGGLHQVEKGDLMVAELSNGIKALFQKDQTIYGKNEPGFFI